MDFDFTGKRVVITNADAFMGPAAKATFEKLGASVIADTRDLTEPDAPASLVDDAGHVDVLLVNQSAKAHEGVPAKDLPDEAWSSIFDVLVHPLHRLVRAVLPQMLERGAGKIVVFGSASGLRSIENMSAYSAARAAQVGYVRAVGAEVGRHNVQINLIAQNWVDNETYFPDAIKENPQFQQYLQLMVPAGRLSSGEEDALFAAFLASEHSNFFVGQAIPFSGGWVQ